MSFVNPNVLRQIFGQGGTIDQADPVQQQAMVSMLAGAGSGMAQAAGQPGARFAQALGGGAQGMMQGQHQHQQRQYMQQQIELQRQKMEEQRQRAKGWQEVLYGPQGDFASQADTGGVPSQQTALSGATITPEAQRGAIAAQQTPAQDVPIGTLGSMFESNGRADAINTGRGDPGGASYGRYQLASGTGTLNNFFESEEGQPFRTQFGDLEPGTPQFDQVWQEVAGDPQVGPQFDQAQQQYMERTHFRPNLERAQRSGFDVANPGVREAVASMGTQHSPAGNLRIFNEAAARVGPDATPQQMVDALYEARTNYVRNLPEGEGGMSSDVKAGVLSRYERERGAAQQLTQVGLPQPAQQVLGGQQAPQNERSGYEQAGGGGLNIPDEVRPLLAMLGPERGAELLAQQAFASPAEQPTAVREALFMAGGDENMARQIMLEKQMAGGQSAAEAQIQRLMETGLSRIEAVSIADNRYVVSHDPVSGEARIMDKATGDRIGSATQGQLTEYESPPRQTLIPPDLDLTKGTGAAAAFRTAWNRARDASGFGLSEGGEQVERAVQTLSNLSLQTEVALAQEIAGRPSNYLLERLREVTVEPAKILQGDNTARERLRATTALIDQKIAMVDDVVRNPSEYRPAEVSQARRNRTQLQFLKEQYDEALGIFSREAPDAETRAQGAEAVFSDEDRALIERWSQ